MSEDEQVKFRLVLPDNPTQSDLLAVHVFYKEITVSMRYPDSQRDSLVQMFTQQHIAGLMNRCHIELVAAQGASEMDADLISLLGEIEEPPHE